MARGRILDVREDREPEETKVRAGRLQLRVRLGQTDSTEEEKA
jgi:hypothetical protein